MTDRPIIFSAPMVRALLEGRKTQTRLLLSNPLAKAQLGDRLWVRESWQYAKQQYCHCSQGTEAAPCDDWLAGIGCRSVRDDVVYFADEVRTPKWRPAIHMPRWASRLTLVVTEVRRQRLQEISEEDAVAEGIFQHSAGWWWDGMTPQTARSTAYGAFYCLWEMLHGKGAWDANPEIVALSFTVHHRNIDALDKVQATERAAG